MNRERIELTSDEKRLFRKNGVRLNAVHLLGVATIREMINCTKQRARELFAFSEFQSVPSVGPRFAEDLIGMDFYSLAELRGKDGARLTDAYEKKVGVWADPCVEDMFRLVVHYAQHPDDPKKWWDFTAERKQYRLKSGYPADRPTRPWYELPQYRREGKLKATRADTRDDLTRRLRKAAAWMKKNYKDPITVPDAARVATLSTYHFLRLFNDVYEETPHQWLTKIRLKRASQLLRKSKHPISRVALDCGFTHEGTFARVFRQHMGESPLQFRRRIVNSLL
ncbi:MAG TPA: helix-hairpin-helix domain-containing protein [Cyclobacteriaceae bacterium]|nr:helix-hairpin-helix domain-containing protein [Cyclobacteriaceae bacterium]